MRKCRQTHTQGEPMWRWRQSSGWGFYMPRNAKGCQKTTKGGRRVLEQVPLHNRRRNQPYWNPGLRPPASRAGRQRHFCCVSHAVHGTSGRQPNKSIHWSCYRKKRDDGKSHVTSQSLCSCPLGQRTAHAKSDVCEWKEDSQKRGVLLERSTPGRPGDVLNNNTIDHSTVVFMDGWIGRLLELRPRDSNWAIQA